MTLAGPMVVGVCACRSGDGPVRPEDAQGYAPPLPSGPPSVGAAEGFLRLPVGTPLGGYTARCNFLGGAGRQDDRDSPYAVAFTESTGVQTYPTIKVVWLSNGAENLVITKTDSIYSADELVTRLTERLEADTALPLAGRVVHTASHSHSSFGDFAHGASWYLGSDRFDPEILERMVDAIAVVAEDALANLQPARIGVGWATDWDPTDELYRDRRSVNDALAPWGPDGPQGLHKDPHLGIVRFDASDGRPIALLANFGMHGTIGGEDNAMVSSDAGGHLELGVEETFGSERVVTMFTQGSGGDASPSTRQAGFAAMESVGVTGAAKIRALYDAIETSDAPIRMETGSRAVPKPLSALRVTRAGAVDWRYAPYDDDPDFAPDNLVYAGDGSLRSPIDEFNTQTGAAFCGSGGLELPIGHLAATVFPYDQCIQVDVVASLVQAFFHLDAPPELPLPETLSASTTVSRIGPLPTLRATGEQVDEDWFVGFFPGEPVYSYGEQWRRRVADELGLSDAMMIGYAQDHEGYLLVPEDWLLGGYEPDIGLYGPLEAEHIMEQVLDYSRELLLTTDRQEDPDPLGLYAPTTYEDVPLPTGQPDLTPDAGARIVQPGPYLWTPFVSGSAPTAAELAIPPLVPRVQGLVQLAWQGGDPMVDAPHVVVERLDGGEWTAVTTAAGRPIDEAQPDVLLAWTPTPLAPADAEQTHQWWAAWQTVSHWDDRAGLPLGTYRLRVTGERYAGGAAHWPWGGEPYGLVSEAFALVPAAIAVTVDEAGVLASLPAPAHGYRLIHPLGSESGDNPLVGPVRLEVAALSGYVDEQLDPAIEGTRSRLAIALPPDWTRITVTDADGNTGAAVPERRADTP